MDEIVPNLWLGNINDANKYAKDYDFIITVMEIGEMRDDEKEIYFSMFRPKNPIKIIAPILIYDKSDPDHWNEWADPQTMTFLADHINILLKHNRAKILVHCAAGVERSPLVIVWYLHRYNMMSIEGAYQFVKRKRPIVEDRTTWLTKCKLETTSWFGD